MTRILSVCILIKFLFAGKRSVNLDCTSNCSLFDTAKVTETPLPMSVLIYTLANFTCVGKGDILKWSLEGFPVTDPSNQDREISVTTNNISVDVWSSVLIIRALPINDGVDVGCNIWSVVGDNIDLDQKGATLTVKG